MSRPWRTDEHWKVEQYSVWAEFAIDSLQCHLECFKVTINKWKTGFGSPGTALFWCQKENPTVASLYAFAICMSIWRDLSQELFGCRLAIWIMPTGECFVISNHFCMHVNLIKFLTTQFWYFSARSDFAVSGRPHSFALPSIYRSLLDPCLSLCQSSLFSFSEY